MNRRLLAAVVLSTVVVLTSTGTALGVALNSAAATSSRGSAAVVVATQARQAQSQRARDIHALGQIYTMMKVKAAFDAAEAKVQQKALVQRQFFALFEAEQAVQTPMWACIRDAESNGRYGITSGAYGILVSTWNAYASLWSPYGRWSVPGEAPPAVQDLVSYQLYKIGGGYGGWHDRCTGIA